MIHIYSSRWWTIWITSLQCNRSPDLVLIQELQYKISRPTPQRGSQDHGPYQLFSCYKYIIPSSPLVRWKYRVPQTSKDVA